MIKSPAAHPEGKAGFLPRFLATNRRRLLQALVIIVAAFVIFWPALRGDWLWDDGRYFTDNPMLHDPARVWKAWFEPGSFIEYYPLEQTVQWMQWKLWGHDTLGYHITNVVLHIIDALLVWRLLSRFGLRWAWLGGLLFAAHPVQVESVAWISELKNTLSLLPLLLAMIFWIDYEEQKRPRDYRLALGLFAAALLCKLSVVLLPLVILLYAWWKRGRLGWADLKTSGPFFAVALLLGSITMLSGSWARQFEHLQADYFPAGGILGRIALAGLCYAFYFSKVFLPVDLLPVYPKWPVDYTSPWDYLPWLILIGVAGWLWTKRQSWGRHVVLGLGFFLINLAPCPGFIPAPNMGYAWVMDHFLYLPIIGLIGLVIAGGEQIYRQLPAFPRPYVIGVIAAVIALLAYESRAYAGLYVDQQTLWTYTLRQNPGAWLAHYNLGVVRMHAGRTADAMEQYRAALRIDPAYAQAHLDLGVTLMQAGRTAEAMEEYRQALQLKPDYAEARLNIGNLLQQNGRMREALEQYEQALQLKPDYAEAHNNLGYLLLLAGHASEAQDQLEEALKIMPDYADAHDNLGLLFSATGRLPQAIDEYEQAVRDNPSFAKACNNLGNALARSGQIDRAITAYRQALQIDPGFVMARDNVGLLLMRMGRNDEAIGEFQRVLATAPDRPETHSNLGIALFQAGRETEAVEQLKTAIRLKPNDPDAHNDLGIVLARMGRLSEAVEQFQIALKLKPDDDPARENLARAQAQLKTVPANK